MILNATIQTSSKQNRVIFIHKKSSTHHFILISIVKKKQTHTGNGQTVINTHTKVNFRMKIVVHIFERYILVSETVLEK